MILESISCIRFKLKLIGVKQCLPGKDNDFFYL
jgi:hypothetical protein